MDNRRGAASGEYNFFMGILPNTLVYGDSNKDRSAVVYCQGGYMHKRVLIAIVSFFTAISVLSWAGPVFSGATLDSSFKPVFATAGSVTGIVPLSDNRLLIIGNFRTVSGVPAKNIARLNGDGAVDTTFRLSSDIEVEQIHAAAVQADGKILIGGFLSHYGATSAQYYLFRLNADGSWDQSFDAGGYDYQAGSYGIDGIVRAIRIDSSGRVLVGGDFTAPGNHIARLNADGSIDESFDSGTGADGAVTHIAIEPAGSIIIGGMFTAVNGVAKRGLARLNGNGDVDAEAFGVGVFGGDLLALTAQPDGKVLIGGSFSQAAGQSVSKMARFNTDGTLDSTFQPIINVIGGQISLIGNYLHEITALAASANYIFVGGWDPVMYFNGAPTDHNAALFVLQGSSGGFHSYASFKGKPTDVWALAKRTDGTVVAGGSFTQRDDPPDEGLYPGLCLLTGEYFQPGGGFKPIVGGQADVRALALQSDGKIIAGGEFYIVNGESAHGVARLSPGGILDATLTPPVTEGGTVTGLLVRSDGKIVMGGTFYDIAGQDYKDVALLDMNGAIEASAYVGGVKALAWQPDGKILAVVSYSPGIRRLNADLTLDETFIPGEGISNSQQQDYEFDRINVVAVQGDGKILLGGSFSTFSGSAIQNIVRLNPNGSIDTTFASPGFTVFNYRSEIFSVAPQADGKILVGGRFSTAGGPLSPTVSRLNADGAVDETFSSPFGDQGLKAYSLLVQGDGKILVGGDMQIIDGVNAYNGLVRLNQDGSRDGSLNTSVKGTVKKILASGDQVVVGGEFEAVDGIPRQGMARFTILRADVNHDGLADLADAILVLKTLAGQATEVFADGDINNDGKIGLPEVEYLLQKMALIR